MTARQPFRRKFEGEKPIADESKSASVVIQLTRKFSATSYLSVADRDASEPQNIGGDAQEDLRLPSFPGESWFGG